MRQLIFVVETDNVAKSDDRYIKRLIVERQIYNKNNFNIFYNNYIIILI